MLRTIFRFLALTTAITGLGAALVMGAANAATPTEEIPLCSKTITDKCIERPSTPARHATRHATHRTDKIAVGKGEHRKG